MHKNATYKNLQGLRCGFQSGNIIAYGFALYKDSSALHLTLCMSIYFKNSCAALNRQAVHDQCKIYCNVPKVKTFYS